MDRDVTVALEPAAEASPRPLALTPGEDLLGFVGAYLGRALLLVVTCTSVLVVFLILVFVVLRSVPFLGGYDLTKFLASQDWRPTADDPSFGALTLIVGSIYVSVAALVFAVPVGILAAVFLSEIVSWKVRNVVKPVVEILAAIPSVAYGFFAILVLAPWLQEHFGFTTGTNALNAALILAVMALPTIISVGEDSISALGRELREASYSLGATRLETVVKVVIPAAHSGLIAAVVLGMMRAIGETMVVWMASGNATQIPHPWWDLSQSIRTMTATIAGEMGEAPDIGGVSHRSALFAVGVILLLMTVVLNVISEYFLSRAKKAAGKT
ncbi:MAG: phosphate ABC transporter permease subunit PstC [Sedimentisphaerales bacterium]|nr:phosphate ABC transporter permease subunit PstC [Sedimentisphaerales bacterium]